MIKQNRFLGIVGFLIFAPMGFAQYTADLTGARDGSSADGAYAGPYQGAISLNGNQIYADYVICDDFNTEPYLESPWMATATNALSPNGTEKFTSPTARENYDAVAWLATQLIYGSSLENYRNEPDVADQTAQTNYSLAIWDITDGLGLDPLGGAEGSNGLVAHAFAAVADGHVGRNVTVQFAVDRENIWKWGQRRSSHNPHGTNPSQELVVVNGPVATPEPSAASVLGLDLLSVAAIVFLVRRYRARARLGL
jgi:hypothetical protein